MDRINWICHQPLREIVALTEATQSEVDPAGSYQRVRACLEAARRRASEAGYPESEQQQIVYALTALADELAMAREGPLREHWSKHPLQLSLFQDNVAGERFFRELERARQAGRVGVVRAYHLCLSFGFRGRHAVAGGDAELAELRDGVCAQLQRSLAWPEALSPDGGRPDQGVIEITRRLPWSVVAAGVLALSCALYLGCRVSLQEQLASFERGVAGGAR